MGEVRAGEELLLVLRYACEESRAVAPPEDSDTLIAEWLGWTDTDWVKNNINLRLQMFIFLNMNNMDNVKIDQACLFCAGYLLLNIWSPKKGV